MKNSFNYSGFCRSASSSNRKTAETDASSPSAKPVTPAADRSCPPYLMQQTDVRTSKTPA